MFKIKAKISEGDSWFIRKIEEQAQKFTGKVEVGFFDSKPHITSGKGGKRTITMKDLAAIHEYGAPGANIPERSFMRASLQLNKGKYGSYLLAQMKQLLLFKTTPTKIKETLGMQAKADIQSYMVNGKFTPLKQATIRRKKSSKPLIDTGQLRQSVTYRIVK